MNFCSIIKHSNFAIHCVSKDESSSNIESFDSFFLSSIPNLSSDLIYCKPLTQKDKTITRSVYTDPEIQKWHAGGNVIETSQFENFFKNILKNQTNDLTIKYVCFNKQNEAVGIFSIFMLQNENEISYGYSIAKNKQKKGYGKAMAQLISEFVIKFLSECRSIVSNNPNCDARFKKYAKIKKITLIVSATNVPSIKCIENITINGVKFKQTQSKIYIRGMAEANKYEFNLV